MRIQHNILAMNSYRNYSNNTNALGKNLEKLSSGYKINRAGDDTAGLAISEKMRAQIQGLTAAQKNVKDGLSLVKTAEGAMQEIQDMMSRMKYLATQSANGTYDNDVDRKALQDEVNQLRSEINRIADSANFNGINLLDGSLGGGGSADGVTYRGSEIAKYKEAEVDVTLSDWTAAVSGKDTFVIDGQTLVIDWKDDAEAAKMFSQFTGSDISNYTADQTKQLAKTFEEFLNSQMQQKGLTGSVTVKATGAGAMKITSNNGTYESEVTWAGTDNAAPTSSLGGLLFGSTAGESKINKATELYNGREITATEVFTMTINGVDLMISGISAKPTIGSTDGTAMSAVAASLKTAIAAAVAYYNTELNLTAGSKDTSSGKTGLTPADFTVKAEDGRLIVTYSGDEDVTFSFSDVGDRQIASSLGIANGSSQAGGAGGLQLQIGDTGASYNQLIVSISNMHTTAIGINGIDIGTVNGANAALESIKDGINYVSSTCGTLGAVQNRLEHTQNNLSVMAENIQDAESTIRDTDVADEMMGYVKNNILIQSAQAMLAQANQIPQGVLQLLG